MQIVVSDPETGKTYQKEIEDKKAKALHDKKIGEEVEGSLIDLKGHSFRITGGSDKQGFPMKRGVKTTERRKLLLEGGTGHRAQEPGQRKRKTVRGEIVSEETQQLNLKVTDKGKKKLAVLFGEEEPEEKEEEPEKDEEEEAEEDEEEDDDADEQVTESEEEKEETEESEEETDYEELAEKNVSEIKEKAQDFEEEEYKKLLESEEQNKDRKTLKEWIENQIE